MSRVGRLRPPHPPAAWAPPLRSSPGSSPVATPHSLIRGEGFKGGDGADGAVAHPSPSRCAGPSLSLRGRGIWGGTAGVSRLVGPSLFLARSLPACAGETWNGPGASRAFRPT